MKKVQNVGIKSTFMPNNIDKKKFHNKKATINFIIMRLVSK